MPPKKPMLPTAAQFARILDLLAPAAPALPEENTGLLVGDPAERVKAVLVCHRLTPATIAKAARKKANLILSCVPAVRSPLKRLTLDEPAARTAAQLLRRGIAAASLGSRLQAAFGGLDDVAADALGLAGRKPLLTTGAAARYKLVVFVPPKSCERVRKAICEAGAGIVGDYTDCTFRTPGTGTFFGSDATDPAVGRKGRLEEVEEERLETVVSEEMLEGVLGAMHGAHPYEEPACDLYPLHTFHPAEGLGRIGPVEDAPDLETFLGFVKKIFEVKEVALYGPAPRKVRTAAVAVERAERLAQRLAARGCDLFVTGEIGPDALAHLRDAGRTVLCVGRRAAERLFVWFALAWLKPIFPALPMSGDYSDPLSSKNL